MSVRPSFCPGCMAIQVDAAQNPSMAQRGGTFSIAAGSILVVLCASRLHSQDVVALTQQGLELMNQGRYREAELPLLGALKLAGPESSTANYNLASLYHRQGRLSEAEKLHRRA